MSKTSPIETRLASSLGQRDEAPNIELAEDLVRRTDADGIKELCDLLRTGKRAVQSDAVKVLYEIGARNPKLLVRHACVFLETMNSKDNRLVWGSLTALATISTVELGPLFAKLKDILSAADNGSVIAKDQAMEILINLKAKPEFASVATSALFERLQSAAVNQLPMYAERISPVLEAEDTGEFRRVLSERLSDHTVASKRKRVEKVLAKLPG